ncbi:MAG: hypothetical protein COU09_01590, partial [Candidatus Harrisonbacteria bacterium CG10_big_fil_rev_8_21_14_0_10_44_23]
MERALFAALILVSTLALVALLIAILKSRLLRRGMVSKSLQLQLFKIQLPRLLQEEGEKISTAEIREKISLMEQFYSQLANIKVSGLKSILYGPLFFALEMAVPNNEKELHFYVAVPRRYAPSAEKTIHGIYADAHIEPCKDYNIFSPDSEVAAANIKSKHRYFPIKNYNNLESDPLSSLITAFSKVGDHKEGLAIQLILQPASSSVASHLSKVLSNLRKGKSLKEAEAHAKKNDNLISAPQKEEDKQKEKASFGPTDEKLIESFQKKSSKNIFTTNIRAFASAATQERADSLLQEITTPFTQFANGDVNSIVAKSQTGRQKQRLAYEFSFRLPSNLNQSYLSTEELASIFHLPNTFLSVPHLATTKAKLAPAPSNLPREGLLLGLNNYRGVESEVRMSEKDRARHFYVIGQTGTGKSVFLQNLIIQDIQAGKGVCFIDPHGDGVEEILTQIPLERIKDVVYFNPSDIDRPMGMNLLEYDPKFPEHKTFIINELLEIFNKLYDMKTAGGPMFEQYFRNATALVMDDPESGNTLLEINRIFVDKAFRDLKLSKTTNPLVKTFWREVAEKAGGEASLQNIVPYISSKFDSFLSNEIMRPIVSQEKSSFRMREIMDQQKILLVNLSKGRLGELNSSLIGLIIVGKILMAAFSRADLSQEERKPFYLYIDEFQNVTTNTIETILSEARKYQLNLTVAHQFIDQLSEEIRKGVFGNVGSIAAFRVGTEDGEFLEKQFSPVFSRRDLINIDNFNCYLRMLINGQTAPAFS